VIGQTLIVGDENDWNNHKEERVADGDQSQVKVLVSRGN
jgi:hypothetical protein